MQSTGAASDEAMLFKLYATAGFVSRRRRQLGCFAGLRTISAHIPKSTSMNEFIRCFHFFFQ